jgi:DUF2934 family protein
MSTNSSDAHDRSHGMLRRPILTVDTSVWLNWLDKKPGSEHVERILTWHSIGLVKVVGSNRIIDPDTWKMDLIQQEQLENEFKRRNIEKIGSSARAGISRVGGLDVLGGYPSERTAEEMKSFRKIVGQDPASLPKETVGKTIYRKIGDYDALYDHFISKRDIFITRDNKDYSHKTKRDTYWNTLGLTIQSPQEFVYQFGAEIDEAVRTAAYYLWENDGKKAGKDWHYWFLAKKQLAVVGEV